MRSLYDNVKLTGVTSISPQSVTGSSAVNGTVIDTKGYSSGALVAYAVKSTSNPSAATLAVKLQEGTLANGGDMADALDNTGTVIGFTLNAVAADAENAARIEGLGLNRKRYLRIVVTPAYTGGTSPSMVSAADILLGRGYVRPTQTTTSNT